MLSSKLVVDEFTKYFGMNVDEQEAYKRSIKDREQHYHNLLNYLDNEQFVKNSAGSYYATYNKNIDIGVTSLQIHVIPETLLVQVRDGNEGRWADDYEGIPIFQYNCYFENEEYVLNVLQNLTFCHKKMTVGTIKNEEHQKEFIEIYTGPIDIDRDSIQYKWIVANEVFYGEDFLQFTNRIDIEEVV